MIGVMTASKIHVCSFESRRQIEMARLIEKFGAVATVAPSMQEVPLDAQPDVSEFADRLTTGNIDITIFLTGVGTEALFAALQNRFSEEKLADEIRKTFVAVRGPKPAATLAKRKIVPDLRAPEPNTWEDLVAEFEVQKIALKDQRIAIQEYGIPSTELYEWFEAREAEVFPVSIYKWELPDDIEPLKSAIRGTIDGQFDILLWTSAQQVVHVMEVAAQLKVQDKWLERAQACVNASIGPTASGRLRERGLEPTMEPSHPKMAHLVREAIECFHRQRS